MKTRIPILMYHQVSSEPHPNFLKYTVTTQAFEAQMKVLKHLGFVPITFAQLINYKERTESLPRKPVIITFDDALQDAIDNAVPILQNLRFGAVFYVTTDFVGRRSSWMIPEVDVEFEIADWPKIKNLDLNKFEIGGHSMTHPHMDGIPAGDCLREMEGSRRVLEDALGHEVRHMAYPHGAYNRKVRDLAFESGYYTATTCEPAFAGLNDDMLSLPRINVGMEDSLFDFICKLYIAESLNILLKNNIWRLRGKIPQPVRRFFKKYLYSRKTN
jgi:peptidoglycan/xylan/chitin deacetylase (PgdA/CDA1 family)